MTYYADPAAPSLSDFLIDRRVTMDDGHWPFGAMGPIRAVCGSWFNPSINSVYPPSPDPALVDDTTWPSVIFGGGANAVWGMSGMTTFNPPVSGDVAARQAALEVAVRTRYEQIGVDPANIDSFVWTDTVYTWDGVASGLGGEVAWACPGSDGTDAGSLQGTLDGLVWTGAVGSSDVRSDWSDRVAGWIDDRIENQGWRFFKPWGTFPLVRPLTHVGSYSGQNLRAYDAGPDWLMALDFWSVVSKRKGERVPWVKFVQMQDLRDPEHPEYAITPWQPEVHLAAGSLFYWKVRGHDARNTYVFIETLDGERPATLSEARSILGADTGINSSIPGLSTATVYFPWHGWKDLDDAGTYTKNVPMRVTAIKANPADLMGCFSMEDLLAKENVKTAFIAELHPYSLTGPAADSRFGPTLFMAQPTAQTRIRLEGGWDGGGP